MKKAKPLLNKTLDEINDRQIWLLNWWTEHEYLGYEASFNIVDEQYTVYKV